MPLTTSIGGKAECYVRNLDYEIQFHEIMHAYYADCYRYENSRTTMKLVLRRYNIHCTNPYIPTNLFDSFE
jgi:hypothetical protein